MLLRWISCREFYVTDPPAADGRWRARGVVRTAAAAPGDWAYRIVELQPNAARGPGNWPPERVFEKGPQPDGIVVAVVPERDAGSEDRFLILWFR